jgi:ribosomal protein S12 methylthiotransferase accessory factor
MTISGGSAVSPLIASVRYRGKEFHSQKKFLDGTHRAAAPEETLEVLRPHFRQAGITRLANITGLDRIGIPTVLAQRPNCPTLSNAAGKGYTLVAASVSAAMEAIEIYHAENIRLNCFQDSYRNLSLRHAVIPQEQLPLTKHSLFDPQRSENWVLGWDLINKEDIAVPYACVAMTLPKDQRPSRWMEFSMGTNGLAGGNVFLEAISAALNEVVERDAIACNRVAAATVGYQFPRVRLESIRSPLVWALLDIFEAAAIKPILFDCTVDTQVPCYMAIIYDMATPHTGLFRGYGAHLDPAVAMIRALTEAAQSRLIAIAGSRDDYFRRDLLSHRSAGGDAGVSAFESSPALIDATHRRSEATDSFEGDILKVLDKLRAAAIHRVIVVDLSDDLIGVPVVRVIVPGLEGYMFDHYAPGPRARAFCAAHPN